MDSTVSHNFDDRNVIDGGSKKRRVVEVESARAGPSRTISPPLPVGFPQPPAGHESTFETWARWWRQCHGSKELSVQMQLAVCRFVRTVGNIQRLGARALNEAAINTTALRTSIGRARSTLEGAIDLVDSVKFDTAERAFWIISEVYDRANAEYKRNFAEYTSSHDMYTSHVEAAAERVELLLICEPEQVISEPVVAEARTVGAPTRLMLLEGLPPINVDPIQSRQSTQAWYRSCQTRM
ncbi:hypothetical protein IW148_004507 [Coemansia sp. RSA 1199]|nr:hypothetical protein IW148_004507 [Coemansia sp. RSA 1199]